MIKPFSHRIILLIFILSINYTYSQEWTFEKEKDGIKIYSCHETVSNFKSYKGEMNLKAEVETVCSIIEDVASFKKYDEDVDTIRVLCWEKGKSFKYYVVYRVPWPFKNRDLCIEAKISTDPKDGSKQINSKSIPTYIPENEHYVRMIDYRQTWTIKPLENGMVHVTLEGYADPAGDIPAWVANMAITDTPLNILTAVRDIVEK
jgi:hypothetical protein